METSGAIFCKICSNSHVYSEESAMDMPKQSRLTLCIYSKKIVRRSVSDWIGSSDILAVKRANTIGFNLYFPAVYQ